MKYTELRRLLHDIRENVDDAVRHVGDIQNLSRASSQTAKLLAVAKLGFIIEAIGQFEEDERKHANKAAIADQRRFEPWVHKAVKAALEARVTHLAAEGVWRDMDPDDVISLIETAKLYGVSTEELDDQIAQAQQEVALLDEAAILSAEVSS